MTIQILLSVLETAFGPGLCLVLSERVFGILTILKQTSIHLLEKRCRHRTLFSLGSDQQRCRSEDVDVHTVVCIFADINSPLTGLIRLKIRLASLFA